MSTFIISAQRPALEAVPCTNTTGILPYRCGSMDTSWGAAPTRNTLPKKPWSSRFQGGASWKTPRQRRRRLELERNLATGNHDRFRLGCGVEIEGGLHRRGGELATGLIEPQERRRRSLHPRRHEVAQRLLVGGGRKPGGQCRADPGSTEARLKALDLELGHGDEVRHPAVVPDEAILSSNATSSFPTEDRSPGAHLHHRPVRRGQPERDPSVVEVGRHAKTRVEGSSGRLAASSGKRKIQA